MDLVNRYVYAVTRSLPEKQRADIEKELRTLIDDMIEENDEPASYESKAQKALLELGDPEILADNYRGSKRYLIGPQFYDKYILILKIVLVAVFAGVTIAIAAEGFFTKGKNELDIVKDYLGALFSGGLQAFAWTTISFMIAERAYMNTADKGKVEKDFMEKSVWSLSQLPVIPEKKALIPIHEPVISIIFSTIFLILLYSTPKVFSAYITFESNTVVIPVFNQQAMQGFRILLISILLLLVLKEVLKLYSRRWNQKLSVAVAVISGISTILTLYIFTDASVWNPDFPGEIMKHMKLTFDFIDPWAKIKSGFIALIVITGVIDIITALYKGIRYNVIK
ncbi:HAAS signaling domain-containing protein [Pseudobacteroides cellulosolvens]|uniref:Uncharacterized protein n=1 Tax=Pseudobacteroides cellulosolvens ATCC 35603 = DSM 2933 TaxID=398512 RepID=A0A0L6JN67_9FIRM|nr:hypothetical protein [Pseudobacteroides cellulosolvens]KNY27204.1 hypothetical protein Bccel_2472 [Pseudobacteroides cellulosolvens ATCC 35603 = DSM 2933]